jgi:hypothetical protein
VDNLGEKCGTYEKRQETHTGVLARKPGGKKSLGRPRRRSEDNIKIDIQETWREVVQ